MLTCVIIDDEPNGVDLLCAMLRQKFAHRVTVAGTATDAESGARLITGLRPQLVFLDVEMPGENGLQMLAALPHRHFMVVFTTAYEQYALEALKTEATDYLLKPISLAELEAAVAKCERRAAQEVPTDAAGEILRKKILLPTGKGSLLVDLSDIIRFEADNNYSTAFFTGRPKLVLSRTLKIFEDQLCQRGFYRVHQSHLVNLRHVRHYEGGDVGYALLSDGSKVEVARRRKADFLKLIAQQRPI